MFVVFTVSAVISVLLFWKQYLGINVLAYILCLHTCFLLTAKFILKRKLHIGGISTLLFLSTVAVGIGFTIQLRDAVNWTNLLLFLPFLMTSFWMAILYPDFLENPSIRGFINLTLGSFVKGIVSGIEIVFYPLKWIYHRFASDPESAGKPNKKKLPLAIIGYVFTGLVLMVIVLAIVIGLLSSADIVFSNTIKDIWNSLSLNFLKDLPGQIFFGGVIGSIVAFTAFFVVSKNHGDVIFKTKPFKPSTTSHIGFAIISAMVLFGMFLVYILFSYIQFKYLFGGVKNITFESYSIQEYAMRGFKELIIVTFLNIAVIYIVKLIEARRGWDKSNLWQKIVVRAGGIGVLLTNFIVLYSAHFRINLYENTYGFTEYRFDGHLVVFFLAVAVLCMLGLINFTGTMNINRVILSLFLIFHIFLTVLPVNYITAIKNVERFKETGKIDIRQLTGDSSISDGFGIFESLPVAYDLLENKELSDKLTTAERQVIYTAIYRAQRYWEEDRKDYLDGNWGANVYDLRGFNFARCQINNLDIEKYQKEFPDVEYYELEDF